MAGPLVGHSGGYEYEFVDPPPNALCCFICSLPYREPHLLGCCGKKICEPCIERVRLAGNPCPFCNQPIATLLDKELRAKVLDLKVYCLNRSIGCTWEGELRGLQDHITKECRFVEEACLYQCGGRFPRYSLAKHESDECPQRPMDVKFESLARKMEAKCEQYEKRIAELEAEVRMCKRKEEKDRQKFSELVIATKEALLQERECCNNAIESLQVRLQPRDHDREARQAVVGYVVGSVFSFFWPDREDTDSIPPHCTLTMPSYCKEKKRLFADWFSPPFFSAPGGYKMCLCVDAYGGTGDEVSVYVHLMQGKNDHKLKWPFNADITVQLLNQKSDENHYEVTLTFIQFDRETSREISKQRKGRPQFITHAELESTTSTTQYLCNDSLIFRISDVSVL